MEFKELLAPVKMENGTLLCHKMALGAMDASGRASVQATGEQELVPADTVIAAVGEKVPTDYYQANGIHVDEQGRALVSSTLESSIPGVYVIGDGLYGPSLVVKGMAHAMTAAEAILGKAVSQDMSQPVEAEAIYRRKGILAEPEGCGDAQRCLGCSTVCENCADVCPNRANVAIQVPGLIQSQIIHVDYMCNECGNCRSFCPYASAPYLDKFTLFASEKDMADSKNQGFVVLDREKVRCKVRYLGEEFVWEKGMADNGMAGRLENGLKMVMETVCGEYGYLLEV